MAVRVLPALTAAVRSNSTARLVVGSVRELKTLPPVILVPGASRNHAQNLLTVGQRDMSVPISDIKVMAVYSEMPGMAVRSTLSNCVAGVR